MDFNSLLARSNQLSKESKENSYFGLPEAKSNTGLLVFNQISSLLQNATASPNRLVPPVPSFSGYRNEGDSSSLPPPPLNSLSFEDEKFVSSRPQVKDVLKFNFGSFNVPPTQVVVPSPPMLKSPKSKITLLSSNLVKRLESRADAVRVIFESDGSSYVVEKPKLVEELRSNISEAAGKSQHEAHLWDLFHNGHMLLDHQTTEAVVDGSEVIVKKSLEIGFHAVLSLAANDMREEPEQLQEVLNNYKNISNDQVIDTHTWLLKGRRGVGMSSLYSTNNEGQILLNDLKAERNTWDLLLSLYNQLVDEVYNPFDPNSIAPLTFEPGSERKAVNLMLQRRVDLQRWNKVVEWLEQNAKDFTYHEGDVDYWGETKRRLIRKENISNLVKQLDPDAPLRGDDGLAENDEEDEYKLLQGIWLMLRSGQLDNAKKLCSIYGQHWRAASLGGGDPLSGQDFEEEDDSINNADNNMNSRQNNTKDGNNEENNNKNIEKNTKHRWTRIGNPNFFLWKQTCWQLSNRRTVSDSAEYERAIYAILSGNLDECKNNKHLDSFEDQTWSLLRSRIDFEICKELQSFREAQLKRTKLLPGSLRIETMASYIKKRKASSTLSPDSIFNILVDKYDDSQSLIRNLQIAIIKDTEPRSKREHVNAVASFINKIGDSVSKARDNEDIGISPTFLRFITHVILFYRNLEDYYPYESPMCPSENAVNIILSTYISYLVENYRINLVAKYVNEIQDTSIRIGIYSDFLNKVKIENDRELVLNLYEGDDDELLKVILFALTKSLLSSEDEVSSSRSVIQGISVFDLDRIDSIKWLCFRNDHRAAAVVSANALARQLLLEGNRETAIEFLYIGHEAETENEDDLEAILPYNSIQVINTNDQLKGDFDVLKIDTAVKEYTCWHNYMVALRSYRNWRETLARSTLEPPPKIDGKTLTRIERAAQQERVLKEYESKMHDKIESLNLAAQEAKEDILSVLNFEGGWLADESEAGAGGSVERRYNQLNRIRQIVIPPLANLYHRILFETGQWMLKLGDNYKRRALQWFEQSIQIADLVASEHIQLYKIFNPNQLQDLLHDVERSMIEILRIKTKF